jgi:hypothetical protein
VQAEMNERMKSRVIESSKQIFADILRRGIVLPSSIYKIDIVAVKASPGGE